MNEIGQIGAGRIPGLKRKQTAASGTVQVIGCGIFTG